MSFSCAVDSEKLAIDFSFSTMLQQACTSAPNQSLGSSLIKTMRSSTKNYEMNPKFIGSEMTYYVLSGTLNLTHSLRKIYVIQIYANGSSNEL